MKKLFLLLSVLTFGFTACGSSDSETINEYQALIASNLIFDSLDQAEASVGSITSKLSFIKKLASKEGLSTMAFTVPNCFQITEEGSVMTVVFSACKYYVSDSVFLTALTSACDISETTQTINGSMTVTENDNSETITGNITLTGAITIQGCAMDFINYEDYSTGTLCGINTEKIDAIDLENMEIDSFCSKL